MNISQLLSGKPLQQASHTTGTKITRRNDFVIDDIIITTANGTTWNIAEMWIGFELCEDLFSPILSGKIIIQDTVNLLKNAPIVGQEQIKISFGTPTPDKRKIEKTFRIYKISERVLDRNGKRQTYKLHFISNEAITNQQDRCDYSFNNMTVLDMISEVFYKHFNQTPMSYGQVPTVGSHSFVLPNKSPFYCINWLASRAINANNEEDCSYIFYQDVDGFHVDTIMNLISKPPRPGIYGGDYEYNIANTTANETPDTFRNIMENSTNPDETIFFEKTHDKVEDIQGGMYGSSAFSYDITTGNYYTNTFNYFDHFTNLFSNMQKKEGEEYHPLIAPVESERYARGEGLASHINLYAKASASHGDIKLEDINNSEQTISQYDSFLKRKSILQQINNNSIIIRVPGDSSRRVGQTVNINIPLPEPIKNGVMDVYDKHLSGKYLVTSLKHLVSRTDYRTVLEMSRNYLPSPLPVTNTKISG